MVTEGKFLWLELVYKLLTFYPCRYVEYMFSLDFLKAIFLHFGHKMLLTKRFKKRMKIILRTYCVIMFVKGYLLFIVVDVPFLSIIS